MLKIGGSIRIAVPNIAAVFERYNKTGDLSELIGLIYGGQRNSLDFHTMGYDFAFLKKLLEVSGFSDVRVYNW